MRLRGGWRSLTGMLEEDLLCRCFSSPSSPLPSEAALLL